MLWFGPEYVFEGVGSARETKTLGELIDSFKSWIKKAVPDGGSKGKKGFDLGNYKFKEGIDEDLRGGKGNFEEALERAFEKTGTPKEDFTVTKWGKGSIW